MLGNHFSLWWKSFYCVLGLLLSFSSQANDPLKLPPLNLGGTSFLDGKSGQGSFVQLVGGYYYADQLKNNQNQAVLGDNTVSSSLYMIQTGAVTEQPLWGGLYGYVIILPYVDVEPDTDIPQFNTGETGFSDLVVSPLVVQWMNRRLFGKPFWSRLNFQFRLPTGDYDANNQVNPGTNSFGFNPHYAMTMDLSSRWSVSWRVFYLWNGKNTDPQTRLMARSSQAGQAFHTNYATSYQVSDHLRLGLAGYYLRQFSDDRVDGLLVAGSRERLHGFGPGLLYRYKDIRVSANAYYEWGAKNRPEGYRFGTRITKVF